MSPGFDQHFKELVRQRTDLVELVAESVQLTPNGRDFKGLCPFHNDHNPSMVISPERGTWRCWVCNLGGDCFSWVMEYDRVDFFEALKILAEKAHLEVPKFTPRHSQGGQQPLEKSSLYDVMKWAEAQFHECLMETSVGEYARRYLMEDRGFTEETMRQFNLGFHPDDWQWLVNRSRNRFPEQLLLEAKLIFRKEGQSRCSDYFVNRVMFPVHDERKRVVAFGGRILPGADSAKLAKYFNSPESVIFTKSKLLFGLDEARQGIRETETVVVVEGYTDCITAHQFGVTNVVATLGTALTESHVTYLKRLARKVVLVFDGDTAGQQAAERALTKFIAQEVDLRILTLPAGQDPADFLEQQGAKSLQQLIAEAPEAWNFKLNLCVQKFGLESIDGQHRILEEMLELLAASPNLTGKIREDIILRKLADRLSLNETVVRKRLSEVKQKQNPSLNPSVPSNDPHSTPSADHTSGIGGTSENSAKDNQLESELLEIIFVYPECVPQIHQHISPANLKDPRLRFLYQLSIDLTEEGIVPEMNRILDRVDDPDMKQLVVKIDFQAHEKAIHTKLHSSPVPHEGIPHFLKHSIQNLKWREEREHHERTKGVLVQNVQNNTLSSDAKELLKKASEFHQKRHKKNSLETH
ncbi:MAG: DNA primase [bacterium]|uniref:DNA primase n=1 Tax=Gimesia chilikensis TaxID=2605989 RepID=A0A517PU66_9PLAN|nr:DNA primase [Gimesia chilikensis]MCR9233353.1 DNA primase [bacterium]QDT22919.1 DNA primase [Gimesia chilikensis]